MVEDVVLAEIFNSGLMRCVDTHTGMREVPEVSVPSELRRMPVSAELSGGFGPRADRSSCAGENALSC